MDLQNGNWTWSQKFSGEIDKSKNFTQNIKNKNLINTGPFSNIL